MRTIGMAEIIVISRTPVSLRLVLCHAIELG
jgi:hypothetical protein